VLDMAEAGLTGPQDALLGPFGYFPLFEDGDPSELIQRLGTRWMIEEISIKPWPSGRASHATLSALSGLSASDVMEIEARVPQLIARLVGRPWIEGMTAAYARLCLPFLAALMLTDAKIDPRRFTPENFADPALRALGRRLTVIVDDNPDPNALAPQTFALTMGDGTRRTLLVPATLGSPANPLTAAQHAEKLAFARSLALVRQAPPPSPLALLTGLA